MPQLHTTETVIIRTIRTSYSAISNGKIDEGKWAESITDGAGESLKREKIMSYVQHPNLDKYSLAIVYSEQVLCLISASHLPTGWWRSLLHSWGNAH